MKNGPTRNFETPGWAPDGASSQRLHSTIHVLPVPHPAAFCGAATSTLAFGWPASGKWGFLASGWWRSCLRRVTRGRGILRFAAQYGSDQGDDNLHGMIRRLYDFARSQPDPRGVAEAADHVRLAAGRSMDELPWYPYGARTDPSGGAKRLLQQTEAAGGGGACVCHRVGRRQSASLQTIF